MTFSPVGFVAFRGFFLAFTVLSSLVFHLKTRLPNKKRSLLCSLFFYKATYYF